MTDLSKGILNINGFRLSKETVVSDFNGMSNDEVKVQISKRGHTYISFLKPVIAGGVEGYVEVSFYKDAIYPEIVIYPRIDKTITDTVEIAKAKVRASKKWLQCIIFEKPTSCGEEYISYEYNWGYIISALQENRDYGLVGGEIKVVYKET